MESTPVLATRASSSPPQARPPRGFTLIEMLVVLAIIVIVTAIAVTGQSAFNKTLLLTDTAYNVAFSARQAQSYGLASRQFGTVQNAGYGLHFSNATPGQYTLFADTARTATPTGACPLGTAGTPEEKHGDCRFSSSDGTVETYSFTRGFTIQKFCAKYGQQLYCSDGSLTALDIAFTRPNVTTTISGYINGSPSSAQFSCAQITIADQTKQATKTVRVSMLGEISIGRTCP